MLPRPEKLPRRRASRKIRPVVLGIRTWFFVIDGAKLRIFPKTAKHKTAFQSKFIRFDNILFI
jgi:hypothetical protein